MTIRERRIYYANLNHILQWQYAVFFVWRDEGAFNTYGAFCFNRECGGYHLNHDTVGFKLLEDACEETALLDDTLGDRLQPVIVGAETAALLAHVYTSFKKQSSRTQFIKKLTESRASYLELVRWAQLKTKQKRA